MLMLKNKATLLQKINHSKSAKDIHFSLAKYPEIAKLAQKKLHLMYDEEEQKYNSLVSVGGLDFSNPYDLTCLKNDLSILVKDY